MRNLGDERGQQRAWGSSSREHDSCFFSRFCYAGSERYGLSGPQKIYLSDSDCIPSEYLDQKLCVFFSSICMISLPALYLQRFYSFVRLVVHSFRKLKSYSSGGRKDSPILTDLDFEEIRYCGDLTRPNLLQRSKCVWSRTASHVAIDRLTRTFLARHTVVGVLGAA